jgi:hypothetical protein
MKNKLTIEYVLIISAVLVIIAVASYVYFAGVGTNFGTKRTDILATWNSSDNGISINIPQSSVSSLENVNLKLVVSRDNVITVYSVPSSDNVIKVSVFDEVSGKTMSYENIVVGSGSGSNSSGIIENIAPIPSPPIYYENDVYDSIEGKIVDVKVCDSYMLFIIDNDVGRFAKAFSPTTLTIPIEENVKISFHYYGYVYLENTKDNVIEPLPAIVEVNPPVQFGYPIIDNIELIG